MLENTQKIGNDRILHDGQANQSFSPDWFEHEHWRRLGLWEAAPGGRGSGARVGAQGQWFLRHYLRGGKAALLSKDRYLYTGARRARPFAEFRILARLQAAGLPAPKPVAARIRRSGMQYSADLVTEWIADTLTLARSLDVSPDPAALMAAAGAVIARFHNAGVCHADLNAHNILVGQNNAVWLVDFDRARLRRPGAWRFDSLRRLERSLCKIGLGRTEDLAALRRQHRKKLRF